MSAGHGLGKCDGVWSTGRRCNRWAIVKMNRVACCLYHFENSLKATRKLIDRVYRDVLAKEAGA